MKGTQQQEQWLERRGFAHALCLLMREGRQREMCSQAGLSELCCLHLPWTAGRWGGLGKAWVSPNPHHTGDRCHTGHDPLTSAARFPRAVGWRWGEMRHLWMVLLHGYFIITQADKIGMLAKCFSHLWDIIACWWIKGKGWRQRGQSCPSDLYADVGNNECHKFLSKCLLFLTNQVLELVWRVFSQGTRYLVLLICYSIHLGTTVGQETKTTLMFLPKMITFGFFFHLWTF